MLLGRHEDLLSGDLHLSLRFGQLHLALGELELEERHTDLADL